MINVAFVIFESVWRRAFGDDGFGLPVLKYRFVLHIINVAALLAYMIVIKCFPLYPSIYCALIIQILFYTLSFYSGFDMGHSYPPTDKEIKDYGIIGKVLKLIFPARLWYRTAFDFAYMTIRYTYPLVLIVYWFNPLLLFVGLIVACGYAIGWHFKPFGMVTEFGEFVMGAALAVGLILC